MLILYDGTQNLICVSNLQMCVRAVKFCLTLDKGLHDCKWIHFKHVPHPFIHSRLSVRSNIIRIGFIISYFEFDFLCPHQYKYLIGAKRTNDME